MHSNYYFNYPPGNRWPLNTNFVKKYFERWKEYPNFQSEGAYTALYMLKTAIEKANKLHRRMARRRRHHRSTGRTHPRRARRATFTSAPTIIRATRMPITGFSMNSPDYPFQILDPTRMITIPIRNITAPPGWPKGEPTSTYTWIDQTWPKASG